MSYKEWEKSTEQKVEIVVYTAGIYFNGAQQTACYWKDGKRKSLDGSIIGANAYGRAIYVVNEDVYVGGSYHYSIGAIPQACYWINGELKEVELENPGYPSSVESLVVINGVVFMAGYEEFSFINYPCYWINNIKYPLYVPNSVSSIATSIYVVQDSSSKFRIYIAGTYDYGGNDEACYWEGGGENITLLGNSISRAHSIFVYGDKIYTGGMKNGNACYWGNDNLEFTSSTVSNNSTHIFITANGDIHLAVYSSFPSCVYFKNNKLKYTIYDREVYSIYIFNDDVYIAGSANIGAGWHASYWKNKNDPIFVDDDGFTGSSIYSIFVASE